MADRYEWWRNAVDGAEIGGPECPVHDSSPQCGFFRKRVGKAGGFEPVAIFEHDGKIIARVGDRVEDAESLWTFVCSHPISEQSYREKMAGKPWPDEDAAVTASLMHAPAAIGDNKPPVDPVQDLRQKIESASANAADYTEIKDDEMASKAQSARSRLLELSGEADGNRETEKRPHLEAGKAIDAKWQPLVRLAKEAADKIRNALSDHETRKAKAAALAKAKADEEAAKARAAGQVPPPAPPPTEAPKARVKGSYGRAASVKTVKVATVTDQDAFYAEVKTNEALKGVFATLAQRMVDAGMKPAGVAIDERQDVR